MKPHHLAAWLITLTTVAAPAAAEEALTLYASFPIAKPSHWERVTLEMLPARWRVGAPDGPPATEGQLRSVLERLGSVAVGGRCAVTSNGPTAYPCSIGMREFGIVTAGGAPRSPGAGAGGSEAWASSRPQALPRSAPAASADPQSEGGSAIGLQSMQLAAVVVSAASLGNRRPAYGRPLHFSVRAEPNPVAGSPFDPQGGVVILRAGTAVRHGRSA